MSAMLRLSRLASGLRRITVWMFVPQDNYAHFDFSYGTPIDVDRVASAHKDNP
ncbi:secreted protein (plasmid) [Rhodococcus opacus]|uniref:Secreted protein n=1 Tax=Rhodococcus opacus TaxID=37919 RepID=A0A1B1KH39_RHOOP|nr:secreted protein [Rhodococcus opacus]